MNKYAYIRAPNAMKQIKIKEEIKVSNIWRLQYSSLEIMDKKRQKRNKETQKLCNT